MTSIHPIIEAFCVNKEFFVSDAVVQWRDNIYQTNFYNSSKGNRLTNMLKLIESGIVDTRLRLNQIDEHWLNESKQKIDDKPEWAKTTKAVRKSCLNSFYNFINTNFDTTVTPYRRHLKHHEIKHILSSVQEKALTKDISPIELCNTLGKINERDAYIAWLMMHTGQTLEAILDLPKIKEDDDNPYFRFKDLGDFVIGEHIPEHILEGLKQLCKNCNTYLFETAGGRRIMRTQVMRNLKQAGYKIGLDFDLTPKLLHGFVNAYMSRDKRSELEKAMGFSI